MPKPLMVDGILARPAILTAETPKSARPVLYVCGKIPLVWIQAAIRVGAGDLAWGIWHHRGLSHGQPMSVSLKKLSLGCKSEATVRRQLRELERAGLITTIHRPGRKLQIEVVGATVGY